jgi:hypothetical protein
MTDSVMYVHLCVLFRQILIWSKQSYHTLLPSRAVWSRLSHKWGLLPPVPWSTYDHCWDLCPAGLWLLGLQSLQGYILHFLNTCECVRSFLKEAWNRVCKTRESVTNGFTAHSHPQWETVFLMRTWWMDRLSQKNTSRDIHTTRGHGLELNCLIISGVALSLNLLATRK